MQSLRLIVAPLAALALLLSVGVALAQSTFTVPISPVGTSGVDGSAVLTAVDGGTSVSFDVTGLAPGATAQTSLHAGTCEAPSASAAALPSLIADPSGRATADGTVLFRGTDPVALSTIADGAHVILVSQSDQVVACGWIPQVEVPSGAGPGMPRTGSALPLLLLAALGLAGLVALRVGLALRSVTSGE